MKLIKQNIDCFPNAEISKTEQLINDYLIMNNEFTFAYKNLLLEWNSVFSVDKSLITYITNIVLDMIQNNICNKQITLKSFIPFTTNSVILSFLNKITDKITIDLILDNYLNSAGQFEVYDARLKTTYQYSEFLQQHINEYELTIKNSDEIFYKIISDILSNNCEHLCKIKINPSKLTVESSDLSKYTLEETIEHELQHLYIFLTAIEKENNRIATWYSKNSLGIRNGQIDAKIKYILDEDEFITLFGTYNNYLIRLFKNICKKPSYTDKLLFIKTFLNFVFNKNISETNKFKYIFLNEQTLLHDVIEFYQIIYQDEKFEYDENIEQVLPKMKKSKFKQLLIWTLKNFDINI
jgi:hypothetical protein